MLDAPTAAGWRIDEARRARVIDAHELGALRDSSGLKRITDFAAHLCATPVALVSLVEETEQTFLSRTGLDVTCTPRAVSFCAHAMLGTEVLIVPDAARDARFADNPLVTGEMGVRFYAGAPLVADDGTPFGSLCVIDTVPRPDGLTPLQEEGLLTLAESVLARFRDSRDAATRRHQQADARRRIDDSDSRFRILADTMPQMVWSTLPDGYHDYYNARWYEFTGMPAGSTDGEAWNGVFHPDDQERAWTVWRESLTSGAPYQIEYRLRHRDGTYRWVLGRALPMRDATGRITRWFGTCTDIHEQKLAFEEREVISQELSHRIKNIFSVISGLIAFAARTHPEVTPLANDLRERITTLGRAHDFVRPHSAKSRPHLQQDSLQSLLEELFRPYAAVGGAPRVRISGDDLRIDDRSATPLALLFHELATNASKYGALSRPGGAVELVIARDDETVRLEWREMGGPSPIQAPAAEGFGSQLIALSAERQLGGRLKRIWASEGLKVTATVPLSAFKRG